MTGLAELIERRPHAAFAAFAALHVAVWTALPSLLYPNLPLDLIEALTYGREWQLGYDKLPPLPWWLVEIAYRVLRVDAAYYALAEIAVLAAFLAVFAAARPLLGALGALVAVLIIDGLHYFNYTAAKFNHDVIELPFWALAGLAFRSGLRTGRIADWVLLGLAIGLALWAKYFVVVLALPIALFLVVDREARRSLATPGPWVACVVALVVMAPHLVWLVKNDFLPFAYASARAAQSRGLVDHALQPAKFAASQLLFLIPALIIAAPLLVARDWRALVPSWWGSRSCAPSPAAADAPQLVPTPADRDPEPGELPPHPKDSAAADAFDRRIVALLAFGPMATLLAVSVVTGRGLVAMWGYPVWLFLGLWIVLTARVAIDRIRLTRIVAAWAVVLVGLSVAFVANYAVLPRYDQRYRAVFFPGDRLANELSERYRAATGTPLAYTIASMWLGGNVGHYAPEHPRVLIDGDPRRAPWIDLADLKARGAVVAWTEGDKATVPAALARHAEGAKVQPPLQLPVRKAKGDRTVTIGWAIVPPAR